jgi:hypothetical protein
MGMSNRRWLCSVSLCVALLVPLTALAEDVVHLKGGGSIHGKVMELIPNEYVNVRLVDGTSRRIEWDQVERVEEGTATVPPPPASGQPVVFAPPGSAPTPSRALTPDEAARQQALRDEIARLELERGQLRSGPGVVMMVVGGASLVFVLPVGIGLWAAAEVCDGVDVSSGSGSASLDGDCSDSGLRTAGIIVSAVGLVGAAVGVVGLVQLIGISGDRRDINDQIKVRQQQLNALSYDLNLGPQRADLMLRLQF